MLVKTLTNEPYRRVHFIYQKIFQCKSFFFPLALAQHCVWIW